jgi:hypothetical protein
VAPLYRHLPREPAAACKPNTNPCGVIGGRVGTNRDHDIPSLPKVFSIDLDRRAMGDINLQQGTVRRHVITGIRRRTIRFSVGSAVKKQPDCSETKSEHHKSNLSSDAKGM